MGDVEKINVGEVLEASGEVILPDRDFGLSVDLSDDAETSIKIIHLVSGDVSLMYPLMDRYGVVDLTVDDVAFGVWDDAVRATLLIPNYRNRLINWMPHDDREPVMLWKDPNCASTRSSRTGVISLSQCMTLLIDALDQFEENLTSRVEHRPCAHMVDLHEVINNLRELLGRGEAFNIENLESDIHKISQYFGNLRGNPLLDPQVWKWYRDFIEALRSTSAYVEVVWNVRNKIAFISKEVLHFRSINDPNSNYGRSDALKSYNFEYED